MGHLRAEKTQNKYDKPETFDFSCIVLGLQRSKCEALRFHAAEISLVSLFLWAVDFFCSIGIPPDSSPHEDGILPSLL